MSDPAALPSPPDIDPASHDVSAPSLWLYLWLIGISVILVILGFHLQPAPDWAGLLLNIAAGFIGSVVILIVVDRRLRANEVEALSRLPAASGRKLRAAVFPSHRVAIRYCGALIQALDPQLQHWVYLPQFEQLGHDARAGFVFRGGPGTGKSTWMHFHAADSARRYLAGEITGRVVITLPVVRWVPERGLHRSLYERFSSFAVCSEWAFERLLKSGLVTVVLDGYEEVFDDARRAKLRDQHQYLIARYPDVSWVLTTRPCEDIPDTFGPVVDFSSPDEDLVATIRERYMRSRRAE